MTTFNPSPYQLAIFDAVADDSAGNLIIEAVAGSGKTTTIIESMRGLSPNASTIFLAFNKSIATELKLRGVQASTFHALGFGGLRNTPAGAAKVDGNKVAQIFRNVVAKQLQDEYYELPRLVSLGKNYGIDIFPELPNTTQPWLELIDYHDLSFPDNNKAADFAKRILNISNETLTTIDFDDMLYLNLRLNAPMRSYDYIFVDEAQDLNGIQLALLRKVEFASPTRTRFIFVGDRHQAIYGFRGAGTDSMERIQREFGCTSLPLSVSYRCPQTVVEFAQRYVPHIQASDSAPAGRITPAAPWTTAGLTQNTAVLCRNTKPLIALAYRLFRANRKVCMLGRDIGAGFKSLIKRAKAQDVEQLRTKLEAMLRAEIDLEQEKARPSKRKIAAITDKYDSLFIVLDNNRDNKLASVIESIDSLFTGGPDSITLATVHKAKGLEWPHVCILNFEQLMPSQYAVDGWQLQQEYNLIYVAVTRAKQHLQFINLDDMETA